MSRFSTAMVLSVIGLLAALSADAVRAQSIAPVEQGRLTEGSVRTKGSPTNVAALGAASVKVSKTAFVDGQNVCGAIRITNVSGQSAIVSGVADSLEVHFPLNVPPPALPAGSTITWFKVADVPIPLPGPIAPGATATIDYCFSLCLATDAPGANAMRNVVAVTLANHSGRVNTVTTRSISFAPPVLDCQACCLPNGSCTDTLPGDCTAAGGLSQGSGTDCTTTECPQACCHSDGTCTDEGPSACQGGGGEPSGPGTNCASTQCCAALGTGSCADPTDCCNSDAACGPDSTCCLGRGIVGCAADLDCCPSGSGSHTAVCEAGRCCAPTGDHPFLCNQDSDCCNPNAVCRGSDNSCCIDLGVPGCADDLDCCPGLTVFDHGAVCETGKCCAPNGRAFLCDADSDCCGPNAVCAGSDHSCCVPIGTSGCTQSFECCPGLTIFDDNAVCESGKCCAPSGAGFLCDADSDCCNPNAVCAGSDHSCCIPIGKTGCTNSFDCCPGLTVFDDGAVCESGKCCAPTGAGFLCDEDTDCCNPNAVCAGSDHSCCIPQFRTGCTMDADCCSGLVCTNGECEEVFQP